MGEQGVFLKYSVQIAFVRRELGDVLPLKKHVTFVRLFKAAQNTQRSSFTASAGTEEGQKLVFSDIEIEFIQNQLTVIGF